MSIHLPETFGLSLTEIQCLTMSEFLKFLGPPVYLFSVAETTSLESVRKKFPVVLCKWQREFDALSEAAWGSG